MKYALSDCRAAEIDRLNKLADGMSDAALKERATADAYQKELKGRIEQLEEQLAKARSDALEEAAKVAYEQRPSSFSDDVGECAHNTAVQCAKAIRALKDNP